MDPQKWDRIEQIVDQALRLEESERERYINETCGNDSELKAQVTELLRSIKEAEKRNYLENQDRFEELKADVHETENEERESSLVGGQVGAYRIVELIGHGGMASVFRAERADEAFQEPVALKVMRRGLDTPSNVARFQRERNILARLDHPNIAHLLDGGVTNEGLPYLVMEYVEGTPIYEYCSRHRLSVDERLQLFKTVCDAVRYAHKNAVIHRDLKPSNILVTPEQNVKVLDFGIAKLMDSTVTSDSQFVTREGERILTMGYAAPEQFEDSGITTAVDVYTLGIVLYELLTGVHPFDMKDKNLSEIEDQIRHEHPPAPSQKLKSRTSEDKPENAETHRRTTSNDTQHTFKGDLDAIVMKCLRKEPESRYNSVDQLLEDLQRREQNLPLVAREDSIRYRTKKFLKRHKNGILTTAAILILIAVIVSFYTNRLSHQKEIAQREAQKAEQVTNFLINLIESNHPRNTQGDTITVREFLNRGYRKVQKMDQSPVVKANIMQVMGETYHSLGEVSKADTLLSKAARMQDTLDVRPAELAKTYNLLGITLRDQGEMKKAEQAMEKSMRLYKKGDKTQTAEFAKLLRDLAYVKRVNGDYDEALPLARRSLRIQRQLFERNNMQTAETHYVLASIMRYQDKYKKAKKHQLTSLRIVKSNVDGPHPGLGTNYNNLAILYKIQDSLKKAARYYQKSLEISRNLYGKIHHNIATGYSNFAGVMRRRGKLDSAWTLLKKAIRIRKKISGGDHPGLAEDYGDLGIIASQQGNYQKADSLFDYSLRIFRKNFNETHPRYLSIAYEKARNALKMGNTAMAKSLFKKILKARIKRHNSSSKLIERPLDQLTDILKEQGKKAIADSLRKVYS